MNQNSDSEKSTLMEGLFYFLLFVGASAFIGKAMYNLGYDHALEKCKEENRNIIKSNKIAF